MVRRTSISADAKRQHRRPVSTDYSLPKSGPKVAGHLVAILSRSMGDYTKVFPEWTFTVRGGVTFIEPVGRMLPSGSIQVTTKPERDTVLDLTLSREARPSFFLQGGARINHLAQASIRHRIYERLSVSGKWWVFLSQFFPNTDSQFQSIREGRGLSIS